MVVVLSAVLICNFLGDATFVAGALNSDSLLPASFAWDVLHVPGAWTHHQVARAPSLIPDMAVYGALYAATGSVPMAELLYGFLQLIGLAYAGGWLAARVAGAGVASGADAASASC